MRFTNVNDFYALGIEAKLLADEHFPKECRERELLINISDAFQLVWSFHSNLRRIQDQIDRVRAIPLPDDKKVIIMSNRLKRIADAMAGDSEDQATLRYVSGLLDIWFDLYLNIEMLSDVSAELRLMLGAQAGDS